MADRRAATPFYAAADSLHAAYNVMRARVPGGDHVALFRELAAESPGPVLELGVGTGRVSIPLALAGHEDLGIGREEIWVARRAAVR